MIEKILQNSLWKQGPHPEVSIITSVYNRPILLERAIKSVLNQTYKNIEYIIVNDGSKENIDIVIDKYLQSADIPMCYVKQTNGGLNSGRNRGLEQVRGRYITLLDSDDELLPNGIEDLYNIWNDIPRDKRNQYREVVGVCEDQDGKLVGSLWPNGINEMNAKERQKALDSLGRAERTSMARADLLVSHKFLEVEGIKYLPESLVWFKLAKQYKSFYTNKIVKRYYTDTSDSMTNTGRQTVGLQYTYTQYYMHKYLIEHWGEYEYSITYYVKTVLKYVMWDAIIKEKKIIPDKEWYKSPFSAMTYYFLKVPGLLCAKCYIYTHKFSY